jgi:hypothetical protein
MSFLIKNIAKTYLLYEGLIYSVSSDTLMDRIGHWMKFADRIHPTKHVESKKIQLKISPALHKEEWELLQKFINNLGWYVASYIPLGGLKWIPFESTEKMINDNPVVVSIEAKFDLEIDTNKFTDVYHISPSVYDEKIKKIGLVPKSKSKMSHHPERVYFVARESDANAMADIFSGDNPVEYSVYKVNLKKARQNDGAIRIFQDPNLNSGFYTLSNIPPEYVTKVKSIRK